MQKSRGLNFGVFAFDFVEKRFDSDLHYFVGSDSDCSVCTYEITLAHRIFAFANTRSAIVVLSAIDELSGKRVEISGKIVGNFLSCLLRQLLRLEVFFDGLHHSIKTGQSAFVFVPKIFP